MTLAEIIRARQDFAGTRRRRRPRERKGRGIRESQADRRFFERELRIIVRTLQLGIAEEIFPILRQSEDEFLTTDTAVRDDFVDDLRGAFRAMRLRNAQLTEARAQVLSDAIAGRVNERNRRMFFDMIEDQFGVDLFGVLDESGLLQTVRLKSVENAELIKSVNEDLLDKVQTLVFENVVQGRTDARSIIAQIQEAGQVAERKARLIARDQTAKLNGEINRQRQTSLGIEEYIWETVGDERVRGSHRARNGKRFRWDSPPPGGPADGGHPSQAIQCRCVARPIIPDV